MRREYKSIQTHIERLESAENGITGQTGKWRVTGKREAPIRADRRSMLGESISLSTLSERFDQAK